MKDLDGALEKLQDANWNYFDRISDDDFERERAERYEQEATDKCNDLQDLILARLRERQSDARADGGQATRPARSEVGSSPSFASINSESDEHRQRIPNDTESETNERMYESQNRPGPSDMFRNSLPRLELETFNGDISDWPRWYSLFKSLVHQ